MMLVRLLLTIGALYGVSFLTTAGLLSYQTTLVALVAVIVVGIGPLRVLRLLLGLAMMILAFA